MKFNRPSVSELSKCNIEEKLVAQIEQGIEEGIYIPIEQKPIQWENVPIISTGSTELDLAISGGRLEEGGIPACILAEFHGPSGSGKTSILAELAACVQRLKGETHTQDPEARMDLEYARIYGLSLDKTNYSRPETVEQIFEFIEKWQPENKLRALFTDSLAALTTQLEQETNDPMGMRRAKLFSQGCRKNARLIGEMLWACSNQEREGTNGQAIVPGGKAIEYYSSLVVRIKQEKKIELKRKNSYGVEVSQIIGIESMCEVRKSTIDNPFRKARIYIVFGRGVDDTRGCLQYLKDNKKTTSYQCPDGKSYLGMEQAILHVEENGLQKELKKQMIEMWRENDALFRGSQRPPRTF